MTLRKQRKDKPSFHNVEQDTTEGMVRTGPDFGVEVDENLYEVRKDKEKSTSEQRKESRETLS